MEFFVDMFLLGYEYTAKNKPAELDTELTRFVEESRGGDLLPHFVAALIERGDNLPVPLKDFVISFLRDPGKWQSRAPGRKRGTLIIRDMHIGAAVANVCQLCDIRPTRNRTQKRACGASIVREALATGANVNLSEADVVKAWDYFRRAMSIGPGFFVLDSPADKVIVTNDFKRQSSKRMSTTTLF